LWLISLRLIRGEIILLLPALQQIVSHTSGIPEPWK
jgi:hypothetical protein